MTTMTVIDPIEKLSKRLKSLDPKLGKEIKNYVPYWWDKELNTSQSAVQQILISLARFANLDIQSVLDESQPLRFKESICNYKHTANKITAELKSATALVDSVAKIVSQINKQEYRFFLEPLQLRNNLLVSDNTCIDFKALIYYCWQQGVPVLYLPELPTSKKMDAVVVDVNKKPVIAITRKCKHESEFLFLLAHEMGHIFHQHLGVGQLLIDENINQFLDTDNQEHEANSFAITLLTGENNTKFSSGGKCLKAKELSEQALSFQQTHRIDAGHIILNWAYSESNRVPKDKRNVFWKTAKSALNIIHPDSKWNEIIKSELINNIDESEAQGDQLEYLYKLMAIEE